MVRLPACPLVRLSGPAAGWDLVPSDRRKRPLLSPGPGRGRAGGADHQRPGQRGLPLRLPPLSRWLCPGTGSAGRRDGPAGPDRGGLSRFEPGGPTRGQDRRRPLRRRPHPGAGRPFPLPAAVRDPLRGHSALRPGGGRNAGAVLQRESHRRQHSLFLSGPEFGRGGRSGRRPGCHQLWPGRGQ